MQLLDLTKLPTAIEFLPQEGFIIGLFEKFTS